MIKISTLTKLLTTKPAGLSPELLDELFSALGMKVEMSEAAIPDRPAAFRRLAESCVPGRSTVIELTGRRADGFAAHVLLVLSGEPAVKKLLTTPREQAYKGSTPATGLPSTTG